MVGLCLAGGGVKGAAHVGVLKALEEEKIDFKYIGGTSSGSIVATLYACGFTADEIYKIFKKYCKKIKYVDFINIIKLIFGVLFTGSITVDGLNSGWQIEKMINKVCNKKKFYTIQDVKKVLAIPSVDLCSGEVICFTSNTKCNNSRNFKGVNQEANNIKEIKNTTNKEKINANQKLNNSEAIKIKQKLINKEEIKEKIIENTKFVNDIEIGKAVRASCSYPVVFSPCTYKNTKLIDGGIRENVPWRELKYLGADKVINVVFSDDEKDDKTASADDKAGNICDKNLIEVASRSINLLCKELSTFELEGSDYTLKIESKKIGLLDMSKIDELYEIGYNEAKKHINDIKKQI